MAWLLHFKTRARRQHHDDTFLMSLLSFTFLIPLLNEVGGSYDSRELTVSRVPAGWPLTGKQRRRTHSSQAVH